MSVYLLFVSYPNRMALISYERSTEVTGVEEDFSF